MLSKIRCNICPTKLPIIVCIIVNIISGSQTYPRHGRQPNEITMLRHSSPTSSERSLSNSSSSSGIGPMDPDSPEGRLQFAQLANSLKQLGAHKCKSLRREFKVVCSSGVFTNLKNTGIISLT